MALSKKKKTAIALFIIIDLIILIPVIWFLIVTPRSEIQSLSSGFILKKYENNIITYTTVSKRPSDWVDLKQMNYSAVHAIVISEDWAFYQHSGYDLNQILEAADEYVKGERKRGASTITQQLAKNLYFDFSHSFHRKLKELATSYYMERNLSKEKILETYLNTIEFGEGIYGIKAASKHYFKKHPKDLNPREGAFLAMLLPNPKKYSQSFKQGQLTDFAKKSIDDILEKMAVGKYITKEQLEKYKNIKMDWENQDNSSDVNSGSHTVEKRVKTSSGKTISIKKKKRYEIDYRNDSDLSLDENPEFDDDAINEDLSGVKEEFNVD